MHSALKEFRRNPSKQGLDLVQDVEETITVESGKRQKEAKQLHKIKFYELCFNLKN